MGTEIAKAEKSRLMIALESRQDTILSSLNKRLDLKYFLATALLHVAEKQYTYEVAQKNPTSFVKAVVKAAEFGLSFARGLAYLVPFKDSVVFVAGYQGLVQVMLRGQTRIHDIRARMVYDNEVFEHLEGTEPRLIHKPLETAAERGAMRGAYAIAFFRDGNLPHAEYMPMCDLKKRREAAKKRNKGKESDAWNDWPEEMYLRPPVRKLFKFLPQTEESQKIMAYEDELWGYDKEADKPLENGEKTASLAKKLTRKDKAEDVKFQDIPPDPETPPSTEPLGGPLTEEQAKENLPVDLTDLKIIISELPSLDELKTFRERNFQFIGSLKGEQHKEITAILQGKEAFLRQGK